ncbi:MAG: periplasmic divalent cation tolerance protein [Kiritimatiellia bacterium]|jgi:periplasmic divalent cation tolerance protein
MNTRFIYMTSASLEEAQRIGRTLVEESLVACVNLMEGMQSIYRWEGEVCEAREVVIIAKTHADKVEALIARVKELHSYECPCIVVLPVLEGNPDYLKWIRCETEG